MAQCMKCGAMLPKGYPRKRCPQCYEIYKENLIKRSVAEGDEIVKPERFDGDDDELTGGFDWKNVVRLKDAMKPEDLNDNGCLKLLEAVFWGARDTIKRRYRDWLMEAVKDSQAKVIYQAELGYNDATRILHSPLFGVASGTDANDLLQAIWEDVEREVLGNRPKAVKLMKNRMRKAREAMTKAKDKEKRRRRFQYGLRVCEGADKS